KRCAVPCRMHSSILLAAKHDEMQAAFIAVVHDVQLAVVAFGERYDVQIGCQQWSWLARRGRFCIHPGEQLAIDEVAEQVSSPQCGRLMPTINVTTRDRAADSMRVFHDGFLECRGGAAWRVRCVGVRAFATAPAVVQTWSDDVHLLAARLVDVAQPQCAVLAIEAPAPRIAKAVCIYLRTGALVATCRRTVFVTGERVGGWNRIGLR